MNDVRTGSILFIRILLFVFYGRITMFSFIANAVTKKMVSNKIIDNDKFDIYAYGFEMLFAYASLVLIILLISILTNSLIESMLFLIGFYVLRKYAGGFHASTYLKCQLLFVINYILFLLIMSAIRFTSLWGVIVFLSIISIFVVFVFAPVDHENRRFNSNEFRHFKRMSRRCAIVVGAVSFISLGIRYIQLYWLAFMIGFFSASCSVAFVSIKEKFKLYFGERK